MFQVSNAAIRAVRTAAQAAVAVLIAAGVGESVFDVNVVVNTYKAAAIIAGNAGIISFLQNIAEDNTDVEVPK